MAFMVLKRLPTEEELEKNAGGTVGIEAHAFLEAFNNKAVSGFIAKVEKDGDRVDLDGWLIHKADWFSIVD